MSEEGSQAPPPPEPKLFKILCCPINTRTGEALVKRLKYPYDKNEEDKNIIIGTKSKDSDYDYSKGVRKIIDIDNRKIFTRCLVECDVIIIDLFEVDFRNVEYAIKTLKYLDNSIEKTLILISSVRTWALTPAKEKREGEEEEDDGFPVLEEDPEDGEEEQEKEEEEAPAGEGEGEEEQEKKEYVALNENDYKKRKTYQLYRKIKTLETLSLAAGKSKPSLKTFVICSGVLYGLGEKVFYPFFRQAWLQEPPALVYYGEGKNKIPTIHYLDLAMHIKYLIYKPPRKIRYVLALDFTRRSQQKNIIKAISKGIGTGLLESVDQSNGLFSSVENYDLFSLDLWMKPSRIFTEPLEEGEEGEDDPIEEDEGEEEEEDMFDDDGILIPKRKKLRLKFNWHCQKGIAKNIKTLTQEFNDSRVLKPNKIVVHGPPCSGRSHFSDIIARFYNLPHIKIRDVVKMNTERKDEFGEELRAHLEEKKQELVEEGREKLEKLRGLGVKGLPEDVDENDFHPRMSNEYLIKCFKYRLQMNDCLNRGYVLDAFPRSYDDARKLFMKFKADPTDEELEDEEEADPPRIIDPLLQPGTAILLRAEQDYMMNFIDDLEETQVIGTHYNQKDLDRRFKVWKKNNFADDGSFVLEDFYSQNDIDSIKIHLQIEKKSDPLKSMKIFIERHGKFNNYQTHEKDEELKRLDEQDNHLKKLEEERLQKESQMQEKEKEDLLVQEAELRLKMTKFRKEEKELVQTHSQKLKNYFSQNLRNVLIEGIYDLSKNMPEDPIDHLADFLFKNAYKVPTEARGDI